MATIQEMRSRAKFLADAVSMAGDFLLHVEGASTFEERHEFYKRHTAPVFDLYAATNKSRARKDEIERTLEDAEKLAVASIRAAYEKAGRTHFTAIDKWIPEVREYKQALRAYIEDILGVSEPADPGRPIQAGDVIGDLATGAEWKVIAQHGKDMRQVDLLAVDPVYTMGLGQYDLRLQLEKREPVHTKTMILDQLLEGWRHEDGARISSRISFDAWLQIASRQELQERAVLLLQTISEYKGEADAEITRTTGQGAGRSDLWDIYLAAIETARRAARKRETREEIMAHVKQLHNMAEHYAAETFRLTERVAFGSGLAAEIYEDQVRRIREIRARMAAANPGQDLLDPERKLALTTFVELATRTGDMVNLREVVHGSIVDLTDVRIVQWAGSVAHVQDRSGIELPVNMRRIIAWSPASQPLPERGDGADPDLQIRHVDQLARFLQAAHASGSPVWIRELPTSAAIRQGRDGALTDSLIVEGVTPVGRVWIRKVGDLDTYCVELHLIQEAGLDVQDPDPRLEVEGVMDRPRRKPGDGPAIESPGENVDYRAIVAGFKDFLANDLPNLERAR